MIRLGLNLIIIIFALASWGNTTRVEEFPCKETKNVIKSYDTQNPSIYRLTINFNDFVINGKRVDLRLEFDQPCVFTNLIPKYISMTQNETSYHVVFMKRSLTNVSLDVASKNGDRPYLRRGYLNNNEILCTKQEFVESRHLDNILRCGERQRYATPLIYGGNNTIPEEWPWHSTIYWVDSNTISYKCGGTLISKSVVITAAHCLYENGATIVESRLQLGFGFRKLLGDNTGQARDVLQIIVHPEFSIFTLANDIAVLKLSAEVKTNNVVQPICLWNRVSSLDDIVGIDAQMVGWGELKDKEDPKQLQHATLTIKNYKDCIHRDPVFYERYLTEKTFCAGRDDGVIPCKGDSGGGLYISYDNVWYLRGIVSLGSSIQSSSSKTSSCDSRFWTIFTDAALHLQFIKNNT